MYRKLLIVMFALLSFGLVQAQDATSTPEAEDAVSTPEVQTDACSPIPLNWCFAGQPWGDGRCNDPDPDVTAYNYLQGFYRAAEACGVIGDGVEDDTSTTTFADSSGEFSFSCTARLRDREVALTANWSTPLKNQSRVVFRYDIGINDDDFNNGETVSISTVATSARGSDSYGNDLELKGAVAYIIDGLNNPISDTVTCSTNS